MRALLLCTLAAVALASCGQKNVVAPRPQDLTQVKVEGFKGFMAGEVATRAGVTVVPNEYRYLPLPAPSGEGEVIIGVVPWTLFANAQKAETLGGLQPANITDLLAFQSSPEGRSVLTRYKRACAPVGVFESEGGMSASEKGIRLRPYDPYSSMSAISDGTRMGYFRARSCEWAIVVLPAKEKAANHVL